jgi:hypothetical protein
VKFRTKPMEVEAVQWLPGGKSIKTYPMVERDEVTGAMFIQTISGASFLSVGDYIVTQMDGKNYYPVRKDIFEKKYEAVE